MYSDKLTFNCYFHKFTGKLREGFSRKVKLIQKLLNRMRDRISTLQYGVFAQTRKANEQDEDYRQVFNASIFSHAFLQKKCDYSNHVVVSVCPESVCVTPPPAKRHGRTELTHRNIFPNGSTRVTSTVIACSHAKI